MVHAVFDEGSDNERQMEPPPMETIVREDNGDISRAQQCHVCCKFFYSSRYEEHSATCAGPPEESAHVQVDILEDTFDVKPSICQQCGQAFIDIKEFEQHQQHRCRGEKENPVKVKNESLPCTECEEIFQSQAELQEHTESCVPGGSLECTTCNVAFDSRDELLSHVDAQHSVEEPGAYRPAKEPEECIICHKTFIKRQNLNKHMVMMHGKMYECKLCDHKSPNWQEFTQHRASHRDKDGKYICMICGKVFEFSRRLRDHMPQHTGAKPYQCDICGKKFPHTASLITHKKIHNKAKCIFCQFCGKGFNFNSNYRRHIDLEHGGPETSVACSLCGEFVNRRHLKTHMVRHGEAKFECQLCEKKYHMKDQLRRHEFRSHNKGLRCEVCGVAYGTEVGLKKHMKTKHPDVPVD